MHLLQKTFVDADQFSDEDIEDDSKQIIDILKDINHSEILTQYELTTIKKEPESLNFKDVLLPKRKKKKPSLFASSEAICQKYKEIRQKKKDQLKFIKQVLMHSIDRRKIKELSR